MTFDPNQERDEHGRWASGGGDAAFPAASGTVDGRVVRDHVPNTDSISASLDEYDTLPGIREVSMASFTLDEAPLATDARTRALAAEIRSSKEINPLIVAVDAKGPYILEGGHRYDALKILKAKSFPALVVLEPGAKDWNPAPTSPRSVTPSRRVRKL